MRAVWKYHIEPPSPMTAEVCILMPEGAELLHITPVEKAVFLWARVDPSRLQVTRCILIYPTGDNQTSEGPYIGTFVIGPFVFHAFDGGTR